MKLAIAAATCAALFGLLVGEHASTADEPSAAEYETLCQIMASQALKRIAPPFPESRMAYYFEHHPQQAKSIPRGPDAMYFRWQEGKLSNWGMTFGGGQGADLATLLRMLINLYPQDLVGEEELRGLRVTGDFIVDVNAPAERVVERLQAILNEELMLKVRLAFEEVEREVYVARGEYKFTPAAEGRERIEIYGDRLNADPTMGGGGSGDFGEMLAWVGMWIEQPVVSEVAAPPKDGLSWHYNLDGPFTDEERRRAKDPKLVLEHLHEQTDLIFTKEKRKQRVLTVKSESPAEPE